MKKMSFVAVLVVAMLVGGIACAPAAPKLTMPEGTEKLSELVPGMGEHWANPAQLPVGPIYLVHDGKVIGVEYMFTTNLMQEVTAHTPEGEMTFKQLPGLPVNSYVNHMGIEFLPEGHEGFEEAHFDVHLYFISPGERQTEIIPHGH